MKMAHWIIFIIAAWLLFAPFVGDDLLQLFIHPVTPEEFLAIIKWDDFLLGLTVSVLALVIVSAEQATAKHVGLRAMHWMQVAIGAFVAISPFLFPLDLISFIWTHVVAGSLLAIFSLLQIRYEHA